MKQRYLIIVCMLLAEYNFGQVSTRLSNGNQFFTFLGNTPWISIPYYGSKGTYFADVNGDGKGDAIVVNNSGVTVRASDGGKFLPNASWTADPYYGGRGTFFADVNGDGKADAIVVNNDRVTVRISDGSKFLPHASWTAEPYYGSRGTYFADVNGDGKADAIVVNEGSVTVRISDGTRFTPNASWTSNPYYGTRGTYFADVNGDGKADAIVVNEGGVTVRISDGSKFLPNASWTSNPYYGTRGTYFADVNGDGKADAIVVNNDRITVRISDGVKFLPNASWTTGRYYGGRGTFFADVNGDKKADAMTVDGPVVMVTKRISGVNYFKLEKPDSKDGYSAQNGFLLVTHDPGCGVVGNDGADVFFQAAGKHLPVGCSVVRTDFAQFWPAERGFDSPWSWLNDAGSYGAVIKSPFYTVRWHNACTGAYNGKNLYYLVSFLISMPEGTDLGEPAFDPGSSMLMSFQPPGGYGWVQAPPPVAAQPPPTKPEPPKTNYYFKVTCSGIFQTCSTLLVPATSLDLAKNYAQNMNQDCTVVQTDYNGYIHGCD